MKHLILDIVILYLLAPCGTLYLTLSTSDESLAIEPIALCL